MLYISSLCGLFFIIIYSFFKDIIFKLFFSMTIYTHFLFCLQYLSLFLGIPYLFRGLCVCLDLTLCAFAAFLTM